MGPTTRFTQSDGVSIAYQVHGEGSVDLIFVSGFVFHVELVWDYPPVARMFKRLASFARLILFDKRGQGLSDRPGRPPTLEESMSDVDAVMRAAGSERAVLFGVSEGGPMSAMFAATRPDRVESLVLYGTYARLLRGPGFSEGLPARVLDGWGEMLMREWGGPVGLRAWAPSAERDAGFGDWWARLLRQGTSPRGAVDLLDLYRELDVRPVLSSITVPTLVLHRRDDQMIRSDQGSYLAGHIPGARLVELPGQDHLPMAGDSDALVDEVEEFVVGSRRTRESERVLATVLFTDIVGSTGRAADVGDRVYGDLLESHNRVVRRELAVHRGREIKTLGDGFLALFDGPARAIRCALGIREAVGRLGIDLRAGVHTGELYSRDGDVSGMAVNIGARVIALAEPREVLASNTVRELVVGSGLKFRDRGSHELKGVPGDWRLFAVSDLAED